MITTLLLLLPLIVGLVLFFIKGNSVKTIALGASIAELVLGVTAFLNFDKKIVNAQFVSNQPWIKSMGINFHIGMDGISLILVLFRCIYSTRCFLILHFLGGCFNSNLLYRIDLGWSREN